MARFVMLEMWDAGQGEYFTVFVNADQVRYVRDNGTNVRTTLVFENGDVMSVAETGGEVAEWLATDDWGEAQKEWRAEARKAKQREREMTA